MKNHLKNQTSPYLLQHTDNPVHWYPWGDEAFERAKAEEKPIFQKLPNMDRLDLWNCLWQFMKNGRKREGHS